MTSELRRVGKKNGDELIEHFMAKATISVDYINQQKQMWDEFLDYFGCGDSVDNVSDEEPGNVSAHDFTQMLNQSELLDTSSLQKQASADAPPT